MNHSTNDSTPYKMIFLIAWCIAFAGFLPGCSGFGEEAPLSDGLYLNYDFGGSSIRVTFSEINSGSFHATLSSGSAADSHSKNVSKQNSKIVNKYLKKESGAAYEAGSLGPLWIAPSHVKQGGNAHGDSIVEVREWEGWEVGVVKASFGQGALSGEWYYDKATGFLVGGMRASIMNADEGGTVFILDDSNLESLFE